MELRHFLSFELRFDKRNSITKSINQYAITDQFRNLHICWETFTRPWCKIKVYLLKAYFGTCSFDLYLSFLTKGKHMENNAYR